MWGGIKGNATVILPIRGRRLTKLMNAMLEKRIIMKTTIVNFRNISAYEALRQIVAECGEQAVLDTVKYIASEDHAHLPVASNTRHCPGCEESLELYGVLPTKCAVCGECR